MISIASMRALKTPATQTASLGILIAGWEFVSVRLEFAAFPPASQVFARLGELLITGTAFDRLASTLLSTGPGFAIAFVLGLLHAILGHSWSRFREISIGVFNIIWLSPTLILVFMGLTMFGHDSRSGVILVTGLVVFPQMAIYFRDVLPDLDPDIKTMAMSYKASRVQLIRDVYLPFLIPSMLAATRVGIVLAWAVVFLAETFGFPDGLGWAVRNSYRLYDMNDLLAWMTLFLISLLLIEQLIRVLERTVVKW